MNPTASTGGHAAASPAGASQAGASPAGASQAGASPAGASQAGSSPAAPLAVTAEWPVRSGALPLLADRFNPRPETAPDLRLALERGGIVALVGQSSRNGLAPQEWLRCCGKTQLAASFAEAQWQAGALDLLVWVDASSQGSVLCGYAEAARVLTGARRHGYVEPAAASFLSWLNQTDRRWLLVLDDLADGGALSGMVPAGQSGHVLITATSPQSVVGLPDALALEVGPFSPREAMSYLVSKLSRDPDQRRGAMSLISDLGCHPVALAHSTATIASSWITCTEYSQLFYRRQAQLRGPGLAPAAPAVTWTLAVDQADQLMPGGSAQSCLALAAMLDGHAIPAALFSTSAAREYILWERGRVSQQADRAGLALSSLEQAGLVSIDSAGNLPAVRMGQSLQRAVRGAMPPDMLGEAARAAADALLEHWGSVDDRTPLAQSMRAGALSLLRYAGDTIWAGGCPAVLIRAGRSLDSAGLPGPAVEYWRELAAVSEQILGPAHPDSLGLVERLAAACNRAGQLDEAVSLHRRIAQERARTLGGQHTQALSAEVGLGRALVAAGDVAGGLAVFDAALAEGEARRSASDPELLALRAEAAAAQLEAGRADQAVRLLRGVLTERERSHGPAHRDTIATRQALAEAYLAAGRTKESITHYRRALADAEKAGGPDDRATLRLRGALAGAYQRAGRMSNAVSMYELARSGSERALGPDDPDTLAACVSLARTYSALGHLGNAATLLRDTLARCEVVLPPGDPITQAAQQSLAGL